MRATTATMAFLREKNVRFSLTEAKIWVHVTVISLASRTVLLGAPYDVSMRREYFVYILRCGDGSTYTGMTNDLRRRLEEHALGINEGAFTHDRRPVRLEFTRSFSQVWDAIHFETVVKKWSRKKKEALIRGDERALRLHSRKKFPKRCARGCKARIRGHTFLVRFSLCEKLLGQAQ